MIVNHLSFGSVTIDDEEYTNDLIIDQGRIGKRKKGASKKYRDEFGHTPLSASENIPWDCKYLIIGAGHSSALPVMEEVYDEARKRGVELNVMSTPQAVKHINDPETNLVLHLTC